MRQLMIVCLLGIATCCRADNDPPRVASATGGAAAAAVPAALATAAPTAPAVSASMLVPEPAWSPRPPRAQATAPVSPTAPATISSDRSATDSSVDFTSEGTWDLAGYNNDEIIYTIFITNHDSRIIRCTTELKGFYFEDGEKHSVSDRQSTTVFPQQRTQAGNWQGMDKSSGATYAVKCHPM
jgi:hypothetical protein